MIQRVVKWKISDVELFHYVFHTTCALEECCLCLHFFVKELIGENFYSSELAHREFQFCKLFLCIVNGELSAHGYVIIHPLF